MYHRRKTEANVLGVPNTHVCRVVLLALACVIVGLQPAEADRLDELLRMTTLDL